MCLTKFKLEIGHGLRICMAPFILQLWISVMPRQNLQAALIGLFSIALLQSPIINQSPLLFPKILNCLLEHVKTWITTCLVSITSKYICNLFKFVNPNSQNAIVNSCRHHNLEIFQVYDKYDLLLHQVWFLIANGLCASIYNSHWLLNYEIHTDITKIVVVSQHNNLTQSDHNDTSPT